MLRAWQLAPLRFAVTRDNVDRLNVIAIAQEMDRGGGRKGRGRNSVSSARPVPICARPSCDRTSARTPYCANILRGCPLEERIRKRG